MLIYLQNRPPQEAQKNHPPPPSPRVTSSPLAASLPHVAPALFVCSPVCLFLWLVDASSLCPLSRATLLCCCRPSCRCQVLPCHVLSRLVIVSRPLAHLVTPALFDCCVIALHLIVTTLFYLVLPLVSLSLHHVASSCCRVASCRVS